MAEPGIAPVLQQLAQPINAEEAEAVVDGWALRAVTGDDRGLFVRLLGNPCPPARARNIVTLLSLTPAGRAIAAQQLLPAGQQAAALFGELPEHDRRELLRRLTEVARHLGLDGIDTPLSPVR